MILMARRSNGSHGSLILIIIVFGRKKPMSTAAFSSDGSVLAVAADKVITLWDPDRNTLLAVIGDSLEVISNCIWSWFT